MSLSDSLGLDFPPNAVMSEPRYRQPDADIAIWHLDGVAWWKAKPPRWLHRHWPQTVGAFGAFADHWRCACGAHSDSYRRGWTRD